MLIKGSNCITDSIETDWMTVLSIYSIKIATLIGCVCVCVWVNNHVGFNYNYKQRYRVEIRSFIHGELIGRITQTNLSYWSKLSENYGIE